jgi:hypothetical protein
LFAATHPGPGQIHLACGEYLAACGQSPDGGFFGGAHGRTELPRAVIDLLAGGWAVLRVTDRRTGCCGDSGAGLAGDGGGAGSDGGFRCCGRLGCDGAYTVRAELDLRHLVNRSVKDNGGSVAPADGRTHAGRSATCRAGHEHHEQRDRQPLHWPSMTRAGAGGSCFLVTS